MQARLGLTSLGEAYNLPSDSKVHKRGEPPTLWLQISHGHYLLLYDKPESGASRPQEGAQKDLCLASTAGVTK